MSKYANDGTYEGSRDDLRGLLRSLSQRPIAYHRIYAEIGGDVVVGLFLSQLLYWLNDGMPKTDPDGWVYKSLEDWHRETFIGERGVYRAREVWERLGVLQTERRGVPPRVFYRVDADRLASLILSKLQSAEIDFDGRAEPQNADTALRETQDTNAALRGNPYNTETTTKITTKTTLSERVPVLPDFAFMGMEKPTTNGSHAPERVVVNIGGYEWAQTEGWRGDKASVQRAADMCIDYYRANGKRMLDWKATLRNWIRRNIQRGEDMTSDGSLAGPNGGGGNGNGAGPGTGRRGETRYGYNSQGEPTNKATNLTETARYLAKRKRELLQPPGDAPDGHVVPLRDDEWRSR